MQTLWDMRQRGIVAHYPQDRSEWLSLRRRAVTASAVGALLGVHDYLTALELWAEKTGWSRDREHDEPSGVMLRGQMLESVALAMIEREHADWKLNPNVIGQGGVYLEDPANRLGATPDCLAYDGDKVPSIIEVKTAHYGDFQTKWRTPDGPEPPLWIALQAMLTAHLVNADHAYVACLVVGRVLDLHIIRVPILPDLIARMQQASRAFWRRVEANEQPSPDYEKDGALITAMMAHEDGSDADLSSDNELVAACAELVEVKEELATLRKRADAHEALIRHHIGVHATVTAGDFRISNKTVERKGYTVAATSYRKLVVREKTS